MRARVSNVEAFRQWQHWTPLNDDDVEPTIDDLVRRITVDPPTDAMLAGTAFHKALELAAFGEHENLSANGYTFAFPDAEIEMPEIRELRVSKDYGALKVSGKADCVLGRVIIDHKSTSRFDPERYLDGYSWRYYLDLFGADEFRWNVFVIRETGHRTYSVAAPQVLNCYRYPEMGKDCADLAGEYLEFATAHLPADFDPLAREESE